jgi:hypothetical protein
MDRNALAVLKAIGGYQKFEGDVHQGLYKVSGQNLEKLTGLNPFDINQAVRFLADHELAAVFAGKDTAPFDFVLVYLNSAGLNFYRSLSRKTLPDSVSKISYI